MGEQPVRTGWWDSPPLARSAGELALAGGSSAGPASIYTDARALAKHAGTWLGLARLLFIMAEDDPENIRLIRSSSIDEDTMLQRRAIIWIAKLKTTASLPEIGRLMNRDHSSVCRSLEEAERLFVESPAFRALCKRTAERWRKVHRD